MAEAATETVSRIRVVGRSDGLEKVKEDLRGIAKAGDEVAVSTQRQERHTVGGQAIAVEITEHCITQRILRTWPDRVGAHIEPQPIADPVPMSREQLRRTKQMARRAS